MYIINITGTEKISVFETVPLKRNYNKKVKNSQSKTQVRINTDNFILHPGILFFW
jgi:hypothetical protein